MTLSAGTVSIGVKPDTSKFGSDLKSGISGVGEGIGSHLGKTIMAGLGIVGIATTIGSAIKTGFGELMDASAGTAQLAAGIKSTSNAANVSVDSLNNLASSIQGYSGQTDDSIVKSEQLLLTFTNIKNSAGQNNDIFNQATKATADLAAKMGGDASGAAIQLGKALNDPEKGITALTRVGVSFTDQQKATIKSMVAHNDVIGAQKIILGELNKEFGGSAAAYGQSLPGMIDRSKRAWEDLTQTFAGTLLPIVTPILEGLLKLFQKVQPYITNFADKVTSLFSNLAQSGGGLQGFLGNLTGMITGWVTGGGLQKMVTGFVSMRDKLMNALADSLPKILDSVVGALVKVLPGIIDALLGMIPGLLATAEKLFSSLLTGLMKVYPTLLKTILDMVPQIIVSLVNMLPQLIEGSVQMFTGLVQAAVKVIPIVITTVVQMIPKVITALVKVIPDLIAGAIKLFMGIVEAVPQIVPQLISAAIKLVPVIIKALMDATPLLIDAGIQLLAGLVKGLIDNAPKMLAAAAKTVGDTLVTGVKAIFGIHSPSVVFHDIGTNIVEGLANGITDSTGLAVASVVKLSKAVTTSFKDGSAWTIGSDGSASFGDALVGQSSGTSLLTGNNGNQVDINAMVSSYNAQWQAIQKASGGKLMMGQAMALADKANGGTVQQRLDAALGTVTLKNAAGASVNFSSGGGNLYDAYTNAGYKVQGAASQSAITNIIYNAAANDSISSEQKLVDAVQTAKVLGAL
jgi:hypothetical protein